MTPAQEAIADWQGTGQFNANRYAIGTEARTEYETKALEILTADLTENDTHDYA